jgi:RNA polymerase-binding transcription factor DksA
MTIDYRHFQKKLEDEKKRLEKELGKVARKNPDNPSDWEPIPGGRDVSQADENTVADSIEEYEEHGAVTGTLEARYKDVLSGLDKIKHNTYGTCETCEEEIEADRLEANPAARTCKLHM